MKQMKQNPLAHFTQHPLAISTSLACVVVVYRWRRKLLILSIIFHRMQLCGNLRFSYLSHFRYKQQLMKIVDNKEWTNRQVGTFYKRITMHDKSCKTLKCLFSISLSIWHRHHNVSSSNCVCVCVGGYRTLKINSFSCTSCHFFIHKCQCACDRITQNPFLGNERLKKLHLFLQQKCSAKWLSAWMNESMNRKSGICV
jgi:hypothetical protein